MLKKILLILSMAFLTCKTQAQTTVVTLYDGENPSSVPSAAGGTPYSDFPAAVTGSSFNASTTGDAGNAGTYINFSATRPSDGGYYLGGFGNGFYVEDNSTTPPTYPSSPIPGVVALDPASHRISIRIKDPSNGKVKVEFKQMTSTKLYSYEQSYSGNSTWQIITISLNQLRSNDPTPIAPSSSDIDLFGEYFIAFNCETDGCSKTILVDDFIIETTPTTELLNKYEMFNNLKIYPNPSSDYINISLDKSFDKVTLAIISDIAGKTLLTKSISNYSENIRLTTANLQNGTYVLTMISEDNTKKSYLFSIER